MSRPYVVAKAGVSLDGRVATKTGVAKWITGEAARAHGRGLRAEAQAIAVGIGTVLADDPALTVRDGKSAEPLRVVFDSKLRLPLDAKVVAGPAPGCLVITSAQASKAREKALLARGVQVLRLPGTRIGIGRALHALRTRFAIERLFVEGGPTLLGALADAKSIDELHLYVAPVLFGGAAPSFVAGSGVAKITSATRFLAPEIDRLGDDVHLRYVKRPSR
jgi:diaminohydroxyphosphoribosylaminopyrimidine deaminase/5-amino-6-(5-phosphoribosylamino)uracil reductase